VQATFVARGFAQEKLLRHQYGFDPETFTPRSGPRSGPFHAVFLGAVEPRKGLHVALEAWRRSEAYRDAHLSVYGRIVEGYEAVLQQYRAMPNVEFHGFTDDAAAVLRSADILLLPSFEEGSALVTYEAQGCGVVPVVSDSTGAQCIHEVSGMVHPAGNAEVLATHIGRLKNDPALLDDLRAAVLAQWDNLTWAAAAARLENCYDIARTGPKGRLAA